MDLNSLCMSHWMSIAQDLLMPYSRMSLQRAHKVFDIFQGSECLLKAWASKIDRMRFFEDRGTWNNARARKLLFPLPHFLIKGIVPVLGNTLMPRPSEADRPLPLLINLCNWPRVKSLGNTKGQVREWPDNKATLSKGIENVCDL